MVWKNVCLCVCVCDPVVPQDLNTPGLPYLVCIHSSEVANIFSTMLEAITKASFSLK